MQAEVEIMSEELMQSSSKVKEREAELMSAKYKLASFIVHHGGGPHEGHYVTWIRNEERGTWVCYNDSNVVEKLTDEVADKIMKGAYIINYVKVRSVFDLHI